jgi:pimeloyl-ACP methyl ester carboxylesterase
MTLTPSNSRTFVLVHGAWHGGWCWSRVADRLRAQGHRVYTPTQTGVGERSHLLNATISLQTFVDDIANLIRWEDLDNVTLVGHSFGGLSITGVADVMPERLRNLVYLDAFILGHGVSTFDTLPAAVIDKMRAVAHSTPTPAPAVPAPKPTSLGLEQADDIAFVAGRLTPQPLSTYETALTLSNPVGNNLPCTYVHCTQPSFAAVESSREWVKTNTNWAWAELGTGHDAMVSDPDALTEMLVKI